MHANDKGEEAPGSLRETRSPFKDKSVSSEPGHTNSLKVIMMHSSTESTFISPKADKIESTQLSLDERADDNDKNEDEDGTDIPPPLFKKCPEDNGEGLRSPSTLAKMAAIRETTRQQRAAQEISSSPIGGRQKPKQKDQTGPWSDRNNQDKYAAPKIKGNNAALERTILFPHGIKPFNYEKRKDNDELQLLALGQTIAQQDKFEGDNETTVRGLLSL